MLSPPRKIVLGTISTSSVELRDILKAWTAISLAFGILLSGGQLLSAAFVLSFVISGATVGIGFLLHELAHKLVAQRYGCFAEFRSFDQFLILSILMSFFGFVFAAPGAVMISGPVGVRRNGKISVAGPATNIGIALAFLSVLYLQPAGLLAQICYYGLYINAFLALFNMLPVWNFDGAKVWPWSKLAYFSVIAIAGALMVTLPYVKP